MKRAKLSFGQFASRFLLTLSALLFLFSWGCSRIQKKRLGRLGDFKAEALTEVTALQLREELVDFGERYYVTLKGASNAINEQCKDSRISKNTLYWRLVTIPHIMRSIQQQHPLAALLDCWAFCAQSRMFFGSPDGERVFGEWASVAFEAAQFLEADIEEVAQLIVKQDRFAKVDTSVNEFAEKHPITGLFARRSARPAMVKASEARSLAWVTDMPLKPFRAFMDESAQAIKEAGQTADRFTAYVRMMPDILRWETQLLLYDIEERSTVTSAVASVETVSRSAERLASVAETLPEDLRTELSALIEDVASRQEVVDKTLKEAQITIDKMQATVASANELAETAREITANASQAGEHWHRAVTAFDTMMEGFREDPEEEKTPAAAPPEEEGRPFDIRDYTETAQQAEAAAVEIRAILSDARGVLDSGSLGANAWGLVWPGVVLIVVFFGCLFLYRLLSLRLLSLRLLSTPSEKPRTATTAKSPTR